MTCCRKKKRKGEEVILPIEDQVCSQEQSFRLIQLGLKVEPAMVWIRDPEGYSRHICLNDEWAYELNSLAPIPAYSVAELSMMLPELCSTVRHDNNTFTSVVNVHYASVPLKHWTGNTEAESKAAMLISLIEDGKLRVEEINHRFSV
jgi:hypothetical protein